MKIILILILILIVLNLIQLIQFNKCKNMCIEKFNIGGNECPRLNHRDSDYRQMLKCYDSDLRSPCVWDRHLINSCVPETTNLICENVNQLDGWDNLTRLEKQTLCRKYARNRKLDCILPSKFNNLCKTRHSNQYESVNYFVKISDKKFIDVNNNDFIFKGTNIVLKGYPWIPNTDGNESCSTITTDPSKLLPCFTFNQFDINHIKSRNLNSIRLSVTWAGAQPDSKSGLNYEFKQRLHNILELCTINNISVLLDNHGDQTSTLNCGYGMPTWFSKEALDYYNYDIGNQLEPSDLSKDIDNILKDIKEAYETMSDKTLNISTNGIAYSDNIQCSDNTLWSLNSGDKNYYITNKCCQENNSESNNNYLGFTKTSQLILQYLFETEHGRNHFINYWKYITDEVSSYECVFGFELINEPMYFNRKNMYETYVMVARHIHSINPYINIGFSEFASGSFINSSIFKILYNDNSIDFISIENILKNLLSLTKYDKLKSLVSDTSINEEDTTYIRESNNMFFCWHWYPGLVTMDDAINNAIAISDNLNVPNIMTESSHCEIFEKLWKMNMSGFVWHYNQYCNTNISNDERSKITNKKDGGNCINGLNYNNKQDCIDNNKEWVTTYGACVLGWGSHGPNHCV